jgi:hypothetical protein
VKSYDSFDGAPFTEHTTGNLVSFLDLSVPIYHLPQYDWVMSLEVAEHIPAKFESIYLDNLARHAIEGVILSWAVPGQSGTSHVNNRDFNYVKSQMEKRGFRHDAVATENLKKIATLFWFKKNINVFRKN